MKNIKILTINMHIQTKRFFLRTIILMKYLSHNMKVVVKKRRKLKNLLKIAIKNKTKNLREKCQLSQRKMKKKKKKIAFKSFKVK